jgi:MFS family permease
MYLIVFLNVLVHGSFIASRVVMALFALELGATPLAIGFMVALYSFPPLFLGVVSGRASDRYGVRAPMLFGTILCGCGLLVPYLWHHIGALYVSAAVIGIGFVFYNVSVQNLTGSWGPRSERGKNFSTLSLGYSISSLIGPLAVGYIIEYFSHATAYLVLSISTLMPIAVIVWWRRLRETEKSEPPPGKRRTFDLLLLPDLRKTLIIGAMVATGWDLYMFYLPIYAHSINLSASTIGIILAIFAVATFVVRALLPILTKRYSTPRVLAAAMYGGAAIFLIFPFVANPWLLGAISFAIGLALGCGQPLTLLLSYNRSPEGRTGEVTGVRFSLNHATHTLVPVISGAIGSAWGVAPVFVMIAAVLAASGYIGGSVVPLSKQAAPPA